MEEYQALLEELRRLYGEDAENIRKGLQGDLLTGYEKYMEEEKRLYEDVCKSFASLI